MGIDSACATIEMAAMRLATVPVQSDPGMVVYFLKVSKTDLLGVDPDLEVHSLN